MGLKLLLGWLAVCGAAVVWGAAPVGAVAVVDAPASGGVVSVVPARVLDTRVGGMTVDGMGAAVGSLAGGGVLSVPLTGRAGVPETGVAGVVVSVAAVDADAAGFLTLWPCGGVRPLASNVNWTEAGGVVAGSAVVMVGEGGDVCVGSNTTVDVVVDVSGWVADLGATRPAGGIGLVEPRRLWDTRAEGRTVDGVGEAGGRIPAGGVLEMTVVGRAGVPAAGVAGVLLSVTVVDPAAAGYVSVYPCNEVRPTVSSVNWTTAGAVVANRVAVAVGAADRVCLFSLVETDVVVDAAGYVTAGEVADDAVGAVSLIRPGRLVDTRTGSVTADGVNRPGRVLAGRVVRVPVSGRVGVPSGGVAAVLLNVTSVGPTLPGYLTVFPCPSLGGGRPLASDVNWTTAGAVVANATVSGLGDGGEVCVYSLVDTDVVVDVFGYVTGPVNSWPTDPPPGAPNGGLPPVVLPGQDAPPAPPAPGDVDGDGHVDDVPVDVAGVVPQATLPGGGRWDVRLAAAMREIDGFVSVAAATPADVGRRVFVEVLDPDEVTAAGFQGAAISVVPVDGLGDVGVAAEIEYERFDRLYGADWPERLSVVAGGSCTWTPDAPTAGCDGDGDEAPDSAGRSEQVATNNLETRTISFTVTFPEGSGVGGVAEPAGFAGPVRKLKTDPAGGEGMVAGLYARFAGSSGSFGATSLSAQGSWSQGGSSGGFNWSYPFTVPDGGFGGPTPGFGLSYSSQAVDAMTSNASSQASQVGLGWSLSGSAFIERSYAPCQAMGGSAQDLCWDGHQVSLVLDGVSSRLVPVPGTEFGEWRLERDNGWRVYRMTGAPGSAADGSTDGLVDDDAGEFWEVRTAAGDVYRFGYGQHAGTALHSVWSVPVIGAHPGDPCSDRPGRVCQQAWRWNLDRVVDSVGRQMVISYQPEFNWYAMLGRPNAAQRYVRGGLVERVWWAIPPGAGVGQARHQIVLTTGTRCEPLGSVCGELSEANRRAFTDVPGDQFCDATGACHEYTPTFFTARRLRAVTTATRTDAGWLAVDQFRLTHEIVGPGGLRRLWLRTIERVGAPRPDPAHDWALPAGIAVDTSLVEARLPAVRFESLGGFLANRADANPSAGVSAIVLPRVTTIRDELGGQTHVEYFQPDPCNPAPASWATNTTNCYPEWWAPTDGAPGWGVFNVWLVHRVSQGTIATDAAFERADQWADTPVVTTYQYPGGAGYRHSERRGTTFKFQSWSQYRGYQTVRTTTADTTVETTYFRGLHGNRTQDGTPADVDVTSSTGLQKGAAPWPVPDWDWLAGRAYETRTLNAANQELNGAVYVPHQVRGLVGADLGIRVPAVGFVEGPIESRMLVVQDTWSRAANTGGGDIYAHWSHDQTTYEQQWGLPVGHWSAGDTLVDAAVANARCTTTVYWPEFAAVGSGATVADRPATVRVRPDACNAAAVATTTYTWDTSGRVVSEDSGAGVIWQVGYGADPYGRPTSFTDPNGNPTTIGRSFGGTVTNPGGGPALTVLERTTVTTAGLAAVTRTGVRGQPVSSTDWQADTTVAIGDGLGRTTAVWSPDSVAGGDAAVLTQRFVYHTLTANSRDAWAHPRWGAGVESYRQLTNGAMPVMVAASFVDGLGRVTQTHTRTPAGGYTVAGQTFDDRGLVVRTVAAFPAAGALQPAAGATRLQQPRPNLVAPAGFSNTIDTTYDSLGRPTRTVETDAAGIEYVTTTAYNGFVTTVKAPGREPVETTTDAYGQTLRVHGTVSGFSIDNVYDARGLLTSGGPDVARVSRSYDAAGRLIKAKEANSGETEYTLDGNGNAIHTVDPETNHLYTTYDALNRPTERRADNPAGPILAEWTYHPGGPYAGLADTTVSHEAGGTYTQTVTGYDGWDRPLGTTYHVDPAVGASFEYTETVDAIQPTGTPSTTTLGAFEGVAAQEVLTATINASGVPTTLTGDQPYVTGTTFDGLGRITARALDGGDLQRGYGFTPRRQLAALTATAAGTLVQDDRYGYHPDGSVAAIDHAAPAGAPDATHRECFDPDADTGRLVRAYTVPVFDACDGTAVLTAAGGVGPDGVGYDETWDFNGDGLMTGRTKRTTANPAPGEVSSFSYGLGPSQISSDGRTGFQYNAYGAREATGNVPQTASFLEVLDPVRVLDTRDLDQDGIESDPIVLAGSEVVIDVSGVVAGDATAVMLNMGIVDPDGAGGSLSVHPAGQTVGTNHPALTSRGEAAFAGLVVAKLNDAGEVAVRVNGVDQHVIADLIGVYRQTVVPVRAGRVLPVTPTRVLDSRDGLGMINDGEFWTVSAAAAGIPDDAVGVIVTVTGIDATQPSYLSVLPGTYNEAVHPSTSTVNLTTGSARANQAAVFVTLDAFDRLKIYAGPWTDDNTDTPIAHVAVDVVAYVTGPGSPEATVGLYTALNSSLNVATANADDPHPHKLAGVGGVPPDAVLVTGVTEFNPDNTGYASVHAADVEVDTSTVNALAGDGVVAGYTTTAVDPNGYVDIDIVGGGQARFNVTGFYRTDIPDPDQAHPPVEPAALVWDTEQRLVETTTSGGDTTGYDYTPAGSRVAQHHPDGSTTFYLGALEATRNNVGVWTLIRRTITTSDGVAVASRQLHPAGTTDYLLGNHQGSITTTIDATTDQPAWRWYDPYGTRRGPDPANQPTTTGFLNQHEDTTTGLTYLTNRYHDPTLGVFISVDPLVTTTFEPYTYASANPVTYSDPLGLCVFGAPCPLDEIANGVETVVTEAGDVIVDIGDTAVDVTVDGANAVADTAVSGANSVVDATTAAANEIGDRGSTMGAYLYESNRRRLSNPFQTAVDFATGTALLEDLSAAEAILGEDGELFHDDEYCGGHMTCIVGVSTPKLAMTTGHTVRFRQTDPLPKLRAHEAQHVFDFETLGGIGFGGAYFGEWLARLLTPIDGGYHDLWSERRSYRVQRGYDDGVRPSRSGPVVRRE